MAPWVYTKGEKTVTPTDRLELKCRTLREWQRPYRRCRDIAHGEEWEFISYPWVDDKRVLVNIRKPHDSTTMVTVNALALEPLQCECANPDCEAGHKGRCPSMATTMAIVHGPFRAYRMCKDCCTGEDCPRCSHLF